MKTFVRIVLSLIGLGILAVLLIAFVPVQRTAPQQAVAAGFKPDVEHGRYLARLGDCAACHTADGGQSFAGGRAIASPLGTIWSTNITPDPKTGIGSYTLADFRAALYDGVRPDGTHLYPAMPYENYRRLSEEDVQSLYAYFMQGVKPVAVEAKVTSLAFPFNQRWAIRVWDWAALSSPGFKPRYHDKALDRGAYIVETLAHCGACHTPRDGIFAQAGIDADSTAFLSGGDIGGWSAPDLRGASSAPQAWSAEDLKAYLSSGRNSHSSVTGEMTSVVGDSLQYATGSDVDAIVAYLRHIGKGGGAAAPASPQPAQPDKTTQLLASADPSMPLGARLYLDNCNACHFVDGKGADGVFPELGGNSLVTAKQTAGLIDVILNGARLPSTSSRPEALAMPGFGKRLSNEEVATLATFVRGAWSNHAGPVTAKDVAARRAAAQGSGS